MRLKFYLEMLSLRCLIPERFLLVVKVLPGNVFVNVGISNSFESEAAILFLYVIMCIVFLKKI